MLQAIADYLAGLPAINELVGERVYVRRAFRTTELPRITLDRVGEAFAHTMEGRDGIARPRIQVDVWARSIDDASDIADRIEAILDGFRGLIGDVTMQGIFQVDRREGFDRRNDASEDIVHRVTLEFEVRATRD